jgi:GntR family transcriptional repressor for pyruvate dehydrogenase complex
MIDISNWTGNLATSQEGLFLRIVAPPSRAQTVLADCRRRIASGEWGPGIQLPPERQLAEEYGVARTVVREAMCALTTLGLIRTRQGGGIYVREAIDQALHSVAATLPAEPRTLHDLMAVRGVLEPLAAALAAQNHRPSDLAALEQNIEAMRGAQTLERKVAAGVEFHCVMARASGNVVLPRLISNLLALFVSSHRLTLSTDVGIVDGIFDHEEIVAAIRDRKVDLARRLVSEHLERTAEILDALMTDRVAASPRGRTVTSEIDKQQT